MLAVSNTSPLSNLAIIDRLELLKRRYGTVRIAQEVADELAALSHPAGKQRIRFSLSDGWLVIEQIKYTTPLPFPFPLDAGEAAAITLAFNLKADVLLIDEKRGREAARQVGLAVAGALGELIYAKRVGWLKSVREEIHKLRQEAHFYVDANIEQFVLSQIGE